MTPLYESYFVLGLPFHTQPNRIYTLFGIHGLDNTFQFCSITAVILTISRIGQAKRLQSLIQLLKYKPICRINNHWYNLQSQRSPRSNISCTKNNRSQLVVVCLSKVHFADLESQPGILYLVHKVNGFMLHLLRGKTTKNVSYIRRRRIIHHATLSISMIDHSS